MKKLVIAGIGLLALIVVSCNPPGVSNYYPLALNNTWSLKTTSTTTMKGTVDTTYSRVDSSTSTVILDTTINGKTAWKVKNEADGITSYGYLVVDDTSIWSYQTPADTMPMLVLKDLSENATWVVIEVPILGALRATVKSKESVTVPAGTFSNAWKVEEAYDSLTTMTIDAWYAANVGEVKNSFSSTTATAVETTSVSTEGVLTAYTVK